MGLNYEIDHEKIETAQIALLIRILASSKAATKTLIELCAKNDQETDEFIQIYSNEYNAEIKSTIEELYVLYGKFDPNELK